MIPYNFEKVLDELNLKIFNRYNSYMKKKDIIKVIDALNTYSLEDVHFILIKYQDYLNDN